MTTTDSASAASVDDHGHPRLDARRARAQAASVGELHPAVLAGRPPAEAGAGTRTELEPPQSGAMQQDGGEEEVALLRLDRLAVDRQRHRCAAAIDRPLE